MGVFKQGERYRARFQYNGNTINVGSFSTKEQAQHALDKARGFGKTVAKATLWDKIKSIFKK